jgi:hypothetical protein
MKQISKYIVLILLLILTIVSFYFIKAFITNKVTGPVALDFIEVDRKSEIIVFYENGFTLNVSGNDEFIDSINQIKWGSFLTGRTQERYAGELIIDKSKYKFRADNTLNGYRAVISNDSGGYWQGANLGQILIREGKKSQESQKK